MTIRRHKTRTASKRWTIRVKSNQLSFQSFVTPDQFGRYGALVAIDALEGFSEKEKAELLEGVTITKGRDMFNVWSKHKPEFVVLGISDDGWVRRRAVAEAKQQPFSRVIEGMDVILVVSRRQYTSNFNPGNGEGIRLELEKVILWETAK